VLNEDVDYVMWDDHRVKWLLLGLLPLRSSRSSRLLDCWAPPGRLVPHRV